ncbi:hypothetical protein BH09ACT4_BH09ACT4_22110 [soil metagenome]
MPRIPQPLDVAQYLPLSARPRVDESRVNADWAAHLTDVERALDAVRGDASHDAAFSELVAAARARRRVRVGDLGRVLVAAYELGESRVVIDPLISGAVALARALSAPLPIRAVVAGRTLTATDADWRFGTGPELSGTARELVLFLYGRGGVPGS